MKIHFSYVFDEELERVYECFTDIRINTGITFKGLITKLKFVKGEERFDEENSEFIAIFKNYYEIKMVVENIKNESYFKTYTNRSLSIDKVPSEISLVYSFYWNSIEEKTIFIFEFVYKDDFFTDLYKNEFNMVDKMKICTNVETYLNSITKGLEFSNIVVINSSFENIYKYFVNLKAFFTTLFKEFIIKCKDEQISLDSEILLDLKISNSPNPIPLISLKLEEILISSNFCQYSFISSKKQTLPNQKLIITLKLLDKHKTFFSVFVKVLECISHESLISLKKLWKKKLSEFTKYFELENKKK